MSILRSVVGLCLSAASLFALAGGAFAQSSGGPTAASPTAAEATAARGAPPPPLVGVVDVLKAVEQYPRYIELRTALEERIRQYEDQLKALAQQLDELRGTIQILNEGTEERAEKEFELQIGLQRQDYLRKALRDRVALEELRNTLMVYEDLEVAIGKVAKQRGVTLVLSKQDITPSAGPVEEMSAREVQGRVKAYDRRQVWFAADELDLTGDVIKLLQVPLAEKPSAPGKRASDGRQESDGRTRGGE